MDGAQAMLAYEREMSDYNHDLLERLMDEARLRIRGLKASVSARIAYIRALGAQGAAPVAR